MAFGKKPPEKFSQYTDPTGEFSNKSLHVGSWYVEHKIFLRNILIGVLLIWSIFSVGYGVIGWGHYVVEGYFQDRTLAKRQIAQFQNYTHIQQSYKALPLDFSPIQIFSPTTGKYDFVTLATNQNQRVLIRLQYRFTFEGGETSVHETFLLPGQTVPVAVLGYDSENYPGNSSLKIESIKYEHVSPHRILKIQDYVSQRTKFSTQNLEFFPPQEGIQASRIRFDITNETGFAFWEAFFALEVLSGGQSLGLLSATIADFQPGETRSVDVSTFFDIGSADEVRLTPIIDIFDSSVYKAL